MDDPRLNSGTRGRSAFQDNRPAQNPPSGPADLDWGRLIELGDVHFAAENLASALEYYERARGLLDVCGSSLRDRIGVEIKLAECQRKRGQHIEASQRLERCLALLDSSGDDMLQAQVCARLGILQSALGNYGAAQSLCDSAYAVLRGTNSNEEIGSLELTMGNVAYRLGQVAKAREHYEGALFTYRRIDHREGIARSLNNLGLLLKNGARWVEAKEYFVRALSVSEEAGNYARVASHCLNLGILHTRTCEWSLAQQYLSRSLHVFRETANGAGQVKANLALGNLRLRLRQDRVAELHYRQALDLSRERGFLREETLALEFLGELNLRQGLLADAETRLTQALTLAHRCAPEGDLVSEVQRRITELWLERGRPDRAIHHALAAAEVAGAIGDAVEGGVALRLLGLAYALTGRVEDAVGLLRRSEEMLRVTPDALELCRSRWALARTLVDQSRLLGRGAGARECGAEAASTLEDLAIRLTEIGLPDLVIAVFLDAADARAAIGDLDEAFLTVGEAIEFAETHAMPQWLPRLEQARTTLEESFAETTVTRSAEYQLLQEIAGLAPTSMDASAAACLRIAAERSRSDRAALVVVDHPRGPKVMSSVGFSAEATPALAGFATELLRQFERGRKLHVMNAPQSDARFAGFGAELGSVAAAVALPVALRDGGDAILYSDRVTDNPAGGYRYSDLRLLSMFAGLMSVYFAGCEGSDRSGTSPNECGADDPYREFVTCSSELKRALALLRKVDRSDVTVLVTGETGTGKGLLARLIHQASKRAAGPFVPVNCAALPETLLESELFGHVLGAFTGAVRAKAGLFDEAEGGTIFLDEIDKAPQGVQAKLLHVLDRHEIRPVGGTRWHSVSVRVVCATNADLRQAIQGGRFLEDLYYRLNDFQVYIPPLRERREDVPYLIRVFYQQQCQEVGRSPRGISRDVVKVLTDHDWRGNVRELEKVVKRMLVLSEDGETIGLELLPREMTGKLQAEPATHAGTLRSEIQKLESRMIRDALESTQGNKSEVARRLHLSYPALLSKIRQYGLEPRAQRRAR